MISNPCKYFVNGHDQKAFTYEGGHTLFHFSPKSSGLSSHMEMNLVFFANNQEHAKRVVVSMLRFKLKCLEEYEQSPSDNLRYGEMEKVRHLLVNQSKFKITKASTDQFYLVGWADNDTA